MIKNYMKIALRNIKRQKIYSIINILGLAIGIASFILIFLYIKMEFSYDTFHSNKDNIFRIIRSEKKATGEEEIAGVQPLPMASALKEEVPGIRTYVKYVISRITVNYRDKSFIERPIFADPEILTVFSFPLIKGNPKNALQKLNSIVLTEKAAKKYFEDENPVGKRISIAMGGKNNDFEVTGVLKKVPDNSSLKFDMILPFKAYPSYDNYADNWGSSRFSIFVMLENNIRPEQLNEQLNSFVYSHFGNRIKTWQKTGLLSKDNDAIKIMLQPLTDIHLNNKIILTQENSSSTVYSYILSGIALLVILIGCINYTTLAIGRSSMRSKEVGVRKVLGAEKGQLKRQFLAEAVIFSFLGLMLGLGLAELFLPYFNELAGTSLNLNITENTQILLYFILTSIIIGLTAGIFPAILLSKFNALAIFTNRLKFGGKSNFARGLVILQYAFCVAFLICTLIISKQVNYISGMDLGYNRENVVVIPVYGGGRDAGEKTINLLRNDLLQFNEIKSITGTSYSFNHGSDQWGWNSRDGRNLQAFIYRADYNYLETMGMNLTEGRNFSKDFKTDINFAVIVNEALVKKFEISEPVGKELSGFGRTVTKEGNDPVIIGVVKDYNFMSLHDQIEPAVLTLHSRFPVYYALVRINPGNINKTISLIESSWKKINPNTPFRFTFLDEDIDQQYRSEKRWQKIVIYASVMSLLIAVLGLVGLTAISINRRFKEIGIRKVLGASSASVIRLLSKEFLILVVFSNIIAWPAAYYIMNKWLQVFAYHTKITLFVFILSGIITIFIALITVSSQSLRAALSNPIKSIRYE